VIGGGRLPDAIDADRRPHTPASVMAHPGPGPPRFRQAPSF